MSVGTVWMTILLKQTSSKVMGFRVILLHLQNSFHQEAENHKHKAISSEVTSAETIFLEDGIEETNGMIV